jgi:HEAT repeat protein
MGGPMTKLQALLQTLTSGDDEQAESVVAAISNYGGDAIPLLDEFLTSPDPDIRWWAVRALAAIDHAEIPPLLQKSLVDIDPSVRHCAALGLSVHPTADAIPDLIAALSGEDSMFARLAAKALIAVGSQAVPPLLDVMQNGPQNARLEAVRALAELGDSRAIGAFFKAIRDGDSSLIEYWSDIGLDRMGIGMKFFKP